MTDFIVPHPWSRAERARWIDLILVLGIGLLINFQNLGEGPLAGTEGNRALVGHQMAQGGNWLIPMLFDRVYLHKPPLHYWIIATLERATGRADVLIWRSPSAVAGALMGAFLCWLGARWYGRLAGLVSGLSCCALVTLWAQNHTAELDALNTLFCVVLAGTLLDLCYGPRPQRTNVLILSCLASAACLLIKGPADVAAVAAPIFGPAILDRSSKKLRLSAPWIVILFGLLVFGIFLRLAAHEIALHPFASTAGVLEAMTNPLSNRLRELPEALILPIVLVIYALPVSLCLPLAFRKEVWHKTVPGDIVSIDQLLRDENEWNPWSDDDRTILRATIATLVFACALTMLLGMVHPRYSYIWLPLICPIAGGLAAAWQRRVFPKTLDDTIHTIIGISAVTLAIGTIVLAILCAVRNSPHQVALWLSAAASAVVCGLIMFWIIRRRLSLAAWGLVGMIVLSASPFGIQMTTDRLRRSTLACSDELRHALPAGTTVIAELVALNYPEMLHYSGLNVHCDVPHMHNLQEFPDSCWLVLTDAEYADWKAKFPDRIILVQRLGCHTTTACLARFLAGPIPATQPTTQPQSVNSQKD